MGRSHGRTRSAMCREIADLSRGLLQATDQIVRRIEFLGGGVETESFAERHVTSGGDRLGRHPALL